MIRYSLRVLDVDGAIPIIMERIAKPETPNVVKTGFSQVIGSLKDAKDCQKKNLHRQIGWAECSCGLMVDTYDGDTFDVVSERLYRTLGHVDHAEAKLTKLFVRKWAARSTDGSFFCWWCVECGYLGKAEVKANGKVATTPLRDHECPSERLRRELLANLKKCLVKPGTKPVVAGVGSWNAAIQKAISLLVD